MKNCFTIVLRNKRYVPVYGEFTKNSLKYINLDNNKLVINDLTETYKCDLDKLPKPKHSNYYIFDNIVDAIETAKILNKKREL